jgi:hypothetical protein
VFFLQASRAPVVVVIGSLKAPSHLRLSIPRYEMDDLVAWGQKVHEELLAKETDGMDDLRRREYIKFYGKVSPTFEELKRLLRTPEGVEHVVTTSLAKATVTRVFPPRDGKGKERTESAEPLTPEQITEYYKVNGAGRLAGLAFVLADMNDSSIFEDPNPDPEEQDNKDPLPKRGKGGSTS